MAISNGPVLCYYGDDFTGSTDVMEALTFAGIRTVLFMSPPDPEELRRFEGIEAIGVAGMTRSMSPDDMEAELSLVFGRFREFKTPIIHYKTCSTFDSSPEVGSIGKAIDLGHQILGGSFVPVVVGAPALQRFCVFGNLFARSGLESEVFRLDRHPTMQNHPITPMGESDLRLHLGQQTDKGIALFDATQLSGSGCEIDEAFSSLLDERYEIVLFDTVLELDLQVIGRLIWRQADAEGSLFCAGSSGIEYALTAYWRKEKLIQEIPDVPVASSVEQVVVISGSCSPVTADQIDYALESGFAEVTVDTEKLVREKTMEDEVFLGVQRARKALKGGQSVILHTGRGPTDPRIEFTLGCLEDMGFSELDIRLKTGKLIGSALGRMLDQILEDSNLTRAATTGGDTSYHAARTLGINALEVVAPLAPGSPLCRVYAPGRAVDGIEMTFKGGQVGKKDFFQSVLGPKS